MDLSMSRWFKIFTLSPGRRLLALRSVLPVARRYDFDELVDYLENAIKHEEQALTLDLKWRAQNKEPSAQAGVVDFANVRKARAKGQGRLLSAVALILGRYYKSRDPEHNQARGDLLGPIMEQNEIIHAYLRARRKVRDVDPDTGEITDEVDLEQPDHLEIDPPPASA